MMDPEQHHESSEGTSPSRGEVRDAYVARRVAEHITAQSEAEAISRTGSETPGRPLAFYVIIGVVIAALLTWLIVGTAGAWG